MPEEQRDEKLLKDQCRQKIIEDRRILLTSYFNAERSGNNKIFTKCCMRGKYVFDFSFDLPDLIKNLLINGHGDSKHFRENIRQFNSALGLPLLVPQFIQVMFEIYQVTDLIASKYKV